MNKTLTEFKIIGLLRLSALGDIIWTLPMLNELKKNYPNSKIVYFCSKPFSDVVEDISGVEFVIIRKPRSLKDYIQAIKKLREYNFDLFLCTQANLRVNILYPFIKSQRKIGFDSIRGRDEHRFFVPEQIPYKKEHALEAFLGFLDYLNLPFSKDKLEYNIPSTKSSTKWHQDQDFGDYICIHPCASHANRTWNVENYIELIKLLINNHSFKVVLTGTANDSDFTGKIKSNLVSDQVLDLAGRTGLKDLCVLFKNSSLVIAPDSGPIHLANAFDTKVLGLYVSLPSQFTGPYGQAQSCIDKYDQALIKYLKINPEKVSWRTRVNEVGMMSLISVKEVYQKVLKILE